MTLDSFWRSPLDPQRVMQLRITHWQEDEHEVREDLLTVEEPLEVRIGCQSLAVIMRTPGHDQELALGFLLTEGIIRGADDVIRVENAYDEDGLPLSNVLSVSLRQQEDWQSRPPAFERHFAVSASCGLCGKNSIADLLLSLPSLKPDTLRVPALVFYQLTEALHTQQAVFHHTGGLHAAALFSLQGDLLLLREDVGRHNAVDKIIGHGLLQGGDPTSTAILLVSGRTSFEIIQKALQARIPYVVAISAPSSMAVELAEKGGITLIGFLRDRSMNVYTHPERVC